MGSQYIIITQDLKPLVDATIAILKEQGSKIPVIQLMPAFKDLFPDDDSEDFEYLPEPKLRGLDDPVCILHSSGAPKYFGLGSAFLIVIFSRLGRLPKADHLHESHLGLLLAFAVVWRP